MKPALLFLCHRIPYPPNKGDKIRSFHLLMYLASRYRVFLGTFVDDPSDWRYTAELNKWCEASRIIKLEPKVAKLRSLKGLLRGQPLTLPYYFDQQMQDWVCEVVEKQMIGEIMVFSSSMAQYVIDPAFDKVRRLVDFVDVDSDKWRQYAERKSWPMKWVYRREAETLLGFESKVASYFDQSLLVSREEAGLFKKLCPDCKEKVGYYSNGVDVEVFKPDAHLSNPYRGSGREIVFTGAMDYWPNEDAVVWFVDEVFPALRQSWPDVRFTIVGGNPTDKVRGLAKIEGVDVTGRVPDVQPYLQHADAVVVPMRIARGIQNKVLEAMSMAKPVVVTSQGLEGINATHERHVLVANDVAGFVAQLDAVFRGHFNGLGAAARDKVVKEYSWESTLPTLDQWLPGERKIRQD